MYFNDSDFEADELNEIHETYDFDAPPSNKDIAQTKVTKPVVCYDLIDLSNSNYSFSQTCFDAKDVEAYFNRMKKLCSSNIEDIINNGERDWHLCPTKGRNIETEIKRITNNPRLNQFPEIMHFALYTSKGMASRQSGVKSPRIHFLVGRNGMICPIFYDPFHEMNPM